MTELHTLTPDITRRYLIIAGPFRGAEEAPLLDGMVSYLAASGARALAVDGRDGPTVRRLRSECETISETATRLRKLKHSR